MEFKNPLYPAQRIIMRYLYRDNNRQLDDSILVAGTARSGTTWLGEILAGKNGRIVFEPFHSRKIHAIKKLSYFPYLNPEQNNPILRDYCQRVFTGTIRHPWIDREITNLRPSFRVVKEIRACLFLKWLQNQFPEVPQILIVRHPCAVVLSRLQLDWATDSDILSFLNQQPLISDFLTPYLEIINQATTDAEKHAIIWCVHHLIPLNQFHLGEIKIVFYEDLYLHPKRELYQIEKHIRRSIPQDTFSLLSKPSHTTTSSSAIMTGYNPITHWQKKLTSTEIKIILDTVKAFGLDFLYGDSPYPCIRPLLDS
jgi:hypothetical protein